MPAHEEKTVMSEGIETITDGSILEVRLNRPKANAIDLATSRRLNDIFSAFRDDPQLRVAIVTGAGDRFFSPGWDLKAAAAGEESDEDWGVGGFGGLNYPRNLDKPLIAAVNGTAAGAGVGLVAMADLAVCGRGSKFSLAYTGVGLTPDAGTSFMLPRTIGVKRSEAYGISSVMQRRGVTLRRQVLFPSTSTLLLQVALSDVQYP